VLFNSLLRIFHLKYIKQPGTAGLNKFLVLADDVGSLGRDINTIRNKEKIILHTNKEAGTEGNRDERKYMSRSRNENLQPSHNNHTNHEIFVLCVCAYIYI
jgi:hypothetical protein